MIRLYALLLAAVAATVFSLSAAVSAQDKKDDKKQTKPPVIKKVMQGDFGQKGLKGKIDKALKDKDFDAAAKAAKDLVALCDGLEKATPPKGEKDSWEKLAANLRKEVAALNKACADKNADDAETATKNIGGACAGCHGEHKPKKKKK